MIINKDNRRSLYDVVHGVSHALTDKTFHCSHRGIAFLALFYNAVSINTYNTAPHPLLAHCFSFSASSSLFWLSRSTLLSLVSGSSGELFPVKTLYRTCPAALSSQAIFSGVGGDQTRAKWKLNNGIKFINWTPPVIELKKTGILSQNMMHSVVTRHKSKN